MIIRLGQTIDDSSLQFLKYVASLDTDHESFYVYKSGTTFILLHLLNENQMKIVGLMEVTKTEDSEKVLKNFKSQIPCRKIFQVNMVELLKSYRGKGLAKKFYQRIVNKEKICLMSDDVLYDGSRKVWNSLIKSSSAKTIIIDILKNKIIDSDYFGKEK